MPRPVCYREAVHPTSIAALQLSTVDQLKPGYPVTPGDIVLWLLPSGPDQVRRAPPHRTLLSTHHDRVSPTGPDLGWASIPVERVPGYKESLAPHLARPWVKFSRRTIACQTCR